ncbi:MAG: DegT/DnrJ/EryC1/StrS aminotransferase family protein [Gammaproteobacteria bacterium]|nr:DegT/DnrJ/EryC1/StrS aminotransferase family protein [Gammaproteobacteria bacterium]
MTEIPPWPYYESDEIEAVGNVLQSGKVNYWTGQECKSFEKEYAASINIPYCLALANGTLALELALYTLDIGIGDDVIVPARTFIATASSVVARGARPIVADVNLNSQNISKETIEAVMTPKTKAIIVVHLAGMPCDMDPILDFAHEYKLKVIEDCAQANGALYKGRQIGCLGDAAIFSFCQDKIITTGGEGGLLALKDSDLWKKAWAYKDHGKDYNLIFAPHSSFGFKWTHNSFGSNWRMTEMQAAIGRIQLKKLPDWVRKRRRNAKILEEAFNDVPLLRVPKFSQDFYHAYYRFYVFVRPEMLRQGWDRDKIISTLNSKGVPCFMGSCPEIYLEKAFVSMGLTPTNRLANARQLGETSIAFLVHPTLSEQNMAEIAGEVAGVMKQAIA